MRTALTLAVDEKLMHGPIAEYDKRIYEGRLRDDEHQRSMPDLT